MQPRRGIVPILFASAFAWLGAACTDAPREVTAPTAVPSFAKDDGGPKGTYVYTNNDVFGMNTVSAFSVGPNGTLTAVPGSPFATGGSGQAGFFASVKATVAKARRCLFVSNTASNDVSAFRIDKQTGALEMAPGSPFKTGGVGAPGISLGVTPNKRFLYAANGGSNNISAFRIHPNDCSLEMLSGSPFPTPPGNPDGVKVSWDGNFLSVALPNAVGTPPGVPPGGVAMYVIDSQGGLELVPGSPFSDGADGVATGTDIDCRTEFNFVPEANFNRTIVDVFAIGRDGALRPIPGSPFNFLSGANSNVGVLSPNDELLFVSNQSSSTLTVLNVGDDGSLTLVPGSPFANPGGTAPSGMATTRDGTFLYVANINDVVTGFRVADNGTLTPVPGSPFATGQPGTMVSLTVWPGKACGGDGGDDVDE